MLSSIISELVYDYILVRHQLEQADGAFGNTPFANIKGPLSTERLARMAILYSDAGYLLHSYNHWDGFIGEIRHSNVFNC